MKITILTLFPEMFDGVFDHSIIKNAQARGVVDITFINIRSFGIGKHRVVDDKPYGGGVGMVMRVDVLDKAIASARQKRGNKTKKQRVVLIDPQGKTFSQQIAEDYAQIDHLILVCGRYEGVDERVRSLVDEEISVGDYVLTGGEIPAMVITDTVVRLLPGALGKDESSISESFQRIEKSNSKSLLLEYPHYTRPESYNKQKVPPILLSGDHAKIENWRREEAVKKTKKRRPDLLRKQ